MTNLILDLAANEIDVNVVPFLVFLLQKMPKIESLTYDMSATRFKY